MSLPAPPASPLRQLPALARLNVAILGLFVGVLTVMLRPLWLHNPDLSHGLFMPVIFLVLLHESRIRDTRQWLPNNAVTNLVLIAFLAAGLFALSAAGLYAAALGWSHALVQFMLAAALTLTLLAGLIGFARESTRFVPLNWSACVAAGLWLLSAPVPHGTYTRLTLALQLRVTENVLRALHVLGVAAQRQGNIIELANGSVGIEEACSGVRSLVSCIFAGLFFSASFVRRPWARVVIILLAAPLALLMNFFRSLTLTLLVNAGIDIAGTWHDVTGFAVLGVTALVLAGLALLLGREPKTGNRIPETGKENPVLPPSTSDSSGNFPVSGIRFPHWILSGGLGLAAALVVLFYANTRPAIRTDKPVPDLLTILPASIEGWKIETSTELNRFSGVLQTEYLAQRSYVKNMPSGPVEITVYLAYWRAGQSAVSQVASHTPDACWPGAGWAPVAQSVTREKLSAAGRELPEAESRLFKYGDFPQHVWFWHIYDGRPIAYENPYSPKALLEIAWRYGFRRDGDQLFVRVSSNAPWSTIASEIPVTQFVANVKSLGL